MARPMEIGGVALSKDELLALLQRALEAVFMLHSNQ
jgi:hypothetical protein